MKINPVLTLAELGEALRDYVMAKHPDVAIDDCICVQSYNVVRIRVHYTEDGEPVQVEAEEFNHQCR